MKKTILTSLATMGLALGAFAQGAVSLDNTAAAHGLVVAGAPAGTFYSGTAGLEVWYRNGAFDTTTINGSGNVAAYALVSGAANGWTLATSFTGKSISFGGFGLGDLHIPGVSPAGSAITLAIAAWQGSGNAWGTGNSGVLAFSQPTADYTAQPPPTSPDLTAATGGFNTTDLVLAPIPEPSSFALAGLGAAALFIFRRRK